VQRARSPLAGLRLYSDPQSPARRQQALWRRQGQPALAAALEPLAQGPTTTWFAGAEADPYQSVVALREKARRSGTVPVVVMYNVVGRDCGLYSAGGATDIDAYLAYVGSVAAGLGDAPAIVVLEPDAIAHALSDCTDDADGDGGDGGGVDTGERYRMLTEATRILKRQKNTRVYIDAGNASWISNTDALAAALKASGIDDADGFALNTANFETTATSITYGQELSGRLDGKHFVIDTSRNGAGPPPQTPDHSSWCNPDGRRIGQMPTTDPGVENVDAYLWVKRPGESDGDCGKNQPPAGQWWPQNALELLGVTTDTTGSSTGNGGDGEVDGDDPSGTDPQQ
jgi:endoglucanase